MHEDETCERWFGGHSLVGGWGWVPGATAYFAQTKPKLDLRLLTSHHVDMVIGASAENSTYDLVEAV